MELGRERVFALVNCGLIVVFFKLPSQGNYLLTTVHILNKPFLNHTFLVLTWAPPCLYMYALRGISKLDPACFLPGWFLLHGTLYLCAPRFIYFSR